MLDREVLINIEVKTPENLALREKYNRSLLTKVLHSKFRDGFEGDLAPEPISEYCFISSFDHKFLDDYAAYEKKMQATLVRLNYVTIYDEDDFVPESNVTETWGFGANIECRRLNPEVIEQFH